MAQIPTNVLLMLRRVDLFHAQAYTSLPINLKNFDLHIVAFG